MSDRLELEHWITKREAAAMLGVAEKTIERMVARGELQKAERKVPKRPPMIVLHPRDVERVKMEQVNGTGAFVVPADMPSDPPKQVSIGRPQTPPWQVRPEPAVPLRDKIFLTMEEAVALSGLGERVLRRHLPWRRLGPHGRLICRRSELDRVPV